MSSDRSWVQALVDCPGAQGLYTYEIPFDLIVRVGDILSVPFGAQQVGAIALVVDSDEKSLRSIGLDIEKIRKIDAVVSLGFFPAHYWTLLSQVAKYYQTPLMQVVRAALPPGLLSRSQRRLKLRSDQNHNLNSNLAVSLEAQKVLDLLSESKTGDYSWRFLQQKVKGLGKIVQELVRSGLVDSYLQPPQTVRPKQQQAATLVGEVDDQLNGRHREILECLKRMGGEAWVSDLLVQTKSSSSVLKTLEKKGFVVLQSREVLRQEIHTVKSDLPKVLTEFQVSVVRSIQDHKSCATILLHGVTGSGKTEVYLQAIAPLLMAGKSALVLVPEIGLTPQLTDRFRARFGDRVRVYHSALSEGERYDTWRQMLKLEPQVVIGTRSAIFAPLGNLGLIVLDEEHDSSFKQDQPAPCYHARTVARWRSQLEDCPLLLGSATPSLESWSAPEIKYLSLPTRVHDRPQPQIEVVDMRLELKEGNRSIFSRSLRDEIAEMKEKGNQGILFIHRRGHSSHVSCRSCGYVMECPNCDVSLSYHHTHATAAELLRCHYCGYTQLQPKICPVCSSIYFKHFGSGTQRVTQELAQEFPELKFLRFDSDTTRTKGAHRSLLDRFSRGDADLLVGTQMLTKGLDLPQVTLVGIVAADGLLHLQDFRSAERACQTLLQVAGRSGRGDDPGRVILQTYSPDHPVIDAVVAQDYGAFARSELETRNVLGYPPIGWVILIRLSSPEAMEVQAAANQVAQRLQMVAQGRYEVLGPSPAMVLRVAQRYRWQILLKGETNGPTSTPVELHLEELRSVCGPGVSLTIDVDPVNLM
ncbi:MAG: primosomal protein N' [Cyanobacteria bacterium]|nr:primosomal protein N' [Cyanobacteriota bacterium]